MENKKTTGKTGQRNKDKDQNKNSFDTPTPRPGREENIVNQQDQMSLVNPQDELHEQNRVPGDFTSEQDLNHRSQQDEIDRTTHDQMDNYDKEDIETDSEDVDNGMKKTPKMNP